MRLLVVSLSMMIITASAGAATWSVDDDGNADFDTIQAAITAAADGDRIEVSPGTYNESLSISGKALQLIGVAGPTFTVVTAHSLGARCLLVAAGISGTTEISGFTFERAWIYNSSVTQGGGVYFGSSVTLSDSIVHRCKIHKPSGLVQGGGVYVGDNACLLKNCRITNNKLTGKYVYGGGIAMFGAGTRLVNCVIEGNHVEGDNDDYPYNSYAEGAGCFVGAHVRIEHCLIRSNSMYSGFPDYECSVLGDWGGIATTTTFHMDDTVVCGNDEGQCQPPFSGSSNLVAYECCGRCGPPGACCMPTGCTDGFTQIDCHLLGGVFLGPYSGCDAETCTVGDPRGACCLVDRCAFLRQSACQAIQGSWLGTEYVCSDEVCSEVAGACLADQDWNGQVDVLDMLSMLADWGPCP